MAVSESDMDVRLRISLAEAEALNRLLRGWQAVPGDDALLDRVGRHVGAILGNRVRQ